MQTRIAWAVVVIGLGFGRALEAQDTNLMQLWQTWNQKFRVLKQNSDCRAAETVYLEGYRYTAAYYYSRLASLPLPNDVEGRSLLATMTEAENYVKQCLQVGQDAGAQGRQDVLPSSDDPPAIQQFFGRLFGGTATTGTVQARTVQPPPQPLQPPPPNLTPGVDPAAVMRLQNEVEQLRQSLNNANAATAGLQNVQIENQQLRANLSELAQVASDPSGLWKITMGVGGAQMETQVVAIVQKGSGFTFGSVGDGKELFSNERDAAGRWVFNAEEGGQKITLYLNLNDVRATRQIHGFVQTPQGTLQFVGMKFGDSRLPR